MVIPLSSPAESATARGFDRFDACAVLLLVLFWCLAVTASRQWSQTSDELAHIAAGYAYNRFADFRMQPENGVLPQRVHGLVPLALGAKFPDDRVQWENSQFWFLGWDFLYGLGNPTNRMIAGARALNALFGVALGGFIYGFARRLHGSRAGVFALGMYILCPNFLFHSAQATSDVAGAFFLLLAPWLFWRHLERRQMGSGLLAGIGSGLALTAKYSGLLIVPIYALLGLVDAWARSGAEQRGRRAGANLLHLAALAAIATAVVWFLYGFRFGARGPGTPELVQFSWPWKPELMFAGWKGNIVRVALEMRALPEGFLRGLDYVLASERERPGFLAGEYSMHGWWWFFPVLFLAKSTIALLVALAFAIAAVAAQWRDKATDRRRRILESLPLGVTFCVVWIAALSSNLNIGHRHILPVYPPLFVLAGVLCTRAGRAGVLIPLGLLSLQAIESFGIRPHYLSHFNLLAGGPARAYRLAVDSSLDWGQDLPALRQWLMEHRQAEEKLYLSYFGNAWPPHYGVRPTRFLPAVNLVQPALEPYEFESGIYAISATSLAEVYSEFRGAWRAEWQSELERGPGGDYGRFARLRFARLCKFLQSRAPDAQPGYSILVFRLKQSELAAALEGPVGGR